MPEGAGAAADGSAAAPITIHGTAVALEGRAALILGPSGAGKSALALQLLALGAALVADDRVQLARRGGALVASPPQALAGLIEARGVGLLRVPWQAEAEVAVAVDLGRTETARLPPPRSCALAGIRVPLLHAVASPHFPAAILVYLRAGGTAE